MMTGLAMLAIFLGLVGGAILLATRSGKSRGLRRVGAGLAVVGASFAVAQVIGPPIMFKTIEAVCRADGLELC
jgi:hypothetical protein